MKACHIFLLESLVLMFSCNNSTTENPNIPYHINIQKDIDIISSIPLSRIGSRLEYLPLEANSDCLIHTIAGVNVYDSLVFVSDYFLGLYVFGRSGNFIRKIGSNGRGPGEYPRVSDFAVDYKHNEVYILSDRKMLVYDLLGKFKKEIVLGFPSHQFLLIKEKELVLHPFNLAQATEEPSYNLYILNRNGKVKTKIPNTLKRVNGGLGVPKSPLYINNDIIHFMEFGIDTLFKYENNIKIPYAIFHLGNLKFPPDPSMEEIPAIDGKIWVSDIMESKKSLFTKIWWDLGDSISYCFIDKLTSEFIVLKENTFFNNIDGGLPFWPLEISDDYMIGYSDAYKLISHSFKKTIVEASQLNSIISNLTENSNPVIIILHNSELKKVQDKL